MKEQYWLKCGYKENGELICVRTLSQLKPNRILYYKDNGKFKKALNTMILKLTADILQQVNHSS
ncbi:hypothetical protein JXI42_07110 [bacterium]|nr:hypothetical protein [bacterium]